MIVQYIETNLFGKDIKELDSGTTEHESISIKLYLTSIGKKNTSASERKNGD